MLTLKVPLIKAEQVRKDLLAQGLFLAGFKPKKDSKHLYLPVSKQFQSEFSFSEQDLVEQHKTKPTTLKEALKDVMPEEARAQLKSSYEQVGDIVILEIDPELREYERVIGETLLLKNTKAASVLAKDASHEGVYRTQKMRFLAGEDKRVAVHKENGILLEVDVQEVYFSARLSTERKRIAELVKPGEDVLVMFSGCGPYTCTLAKNTLAESVTGIEINPKGHELAQKNVMRNKLRNVVNYCGDVNVVLPELLKKRGKGFDRIVMPLPKSAETFLDAALEAANTGCVIHFYAFLHQDEFSSAVKWIEEACKNKKRDYAILSTTMCGQQAPYVYRICVDFIAK